MNKVLLVLALCSGVCVATPSEPTDNEVALLTYLHTLKATDDPASVVINNLGVGRHNTTTIACMEYRTKNAFGSYVTLRAVSVVEGNRYHYMKGSPYNNTLFDKWCTIKGVKYLQDDAYVSELTTKQPLYVSNLYKLHL